MLFLFLPWERDDGRIVGLRARAHADRRTLVYGCASFAIRHPYIRIRPGRHRKISRHERVPDNFLISPCATIISKPEA